MSEVKITPIEIENGIGFKGAVSISDEELKNRVDFLEQHTKEFSELVIKAENELYIRELLQRNENLKQELEKYKNIIDEAIKYNKELCELYDCGMELSNAQTNLVILEADGYKLNELKGAD